eukprot:75926_1
MANDSNEPFESNDSLDIIRANNEINEWQYWYINHGWVHRIFITGIRMQSMHAVFEIRHFASDSWSRGHFAAEIFVVRWDISQQESDVSADLASDVSADLVMMRQNDRQNG